MRNARVINVAMVGEHAGAVPVEDIIEPVGEHARVIDLPIAVAILEKFDSIGTLGVIGDLVPQVLFLVRQPILNRLRRQIFVEPIHVRPVIFDAVLDAERLGHENPPPLVEAKCNRIRQIRLRRDELCFHPLGNGEGSDCSLAFVGGGFDVRLERGADF